MTIIVDLPNTFCSAGAPAAVRPAAAASKSPARDAAAVGTSSREASATTAPGMAHPLDIPEFLKRRT